MNSRRGNDAGIKPLRRPFGAARWLVALFLAAFLVDSAYLASIWPQWPQYAKGPVPQSSFIRAYAAKTKDDAALPPLRWRPIPLAQIPRHMVRAVVVAEDARFYQHDGFDTEALKEAIEFNLTEKRLAFGASTISQQTVKNMFLTPSRNPVRKWHEVVFTWGMERQLSKRRILELYLNVAEFGRGIYGVEAAAQYYWGIQAAELMPWQAVELAATLPAPTKHNPKTRTRFFLKRQKKLMGFMEKLLQPPPDTQQTAAQHEASVAETR